MQKTDEREKVLFSFVLSLFLTMVFVVPFGHASQNLDEITPDIEAPLLQSQVIRLSIDSASLGFKAPFMVYLPKGYGPGNAYPVWYGLHSYSTGVTMWLNAGAGRIADDLAETGKMRPMIMVFPLTRYDPSKVIVEDMKDGIRGASQMEQFLCGELIPCIDAHFNTLQSSGVRYIGGFSMGGYFALEIALRHPDLFGKVGAYSPALMDSDYSGGRLEKWLYPGDKPNEVPYAAGTAKDKGLDALKVYLDVGKGNDPFLQGAQSLYQVLVDLGMDVSFDMYDGGHTLQLDKMAEYLLFYGGK